MKLPLLLATFLLFFAQSARLSAQSSDIPVSGPEELRQHVDPAKAEVDRFLAFYDQKNFKAAEKMIRGSPGLERTSEYLAKKFGKFEGRTLLAIRVADTYAPEPDGTYIVFNYTSVFEKKKSFPVRAIVRLTDQGKYEVIRFGSTQ